MTVFCIESASDSQKRVCDMKSKKQNTEVIILLSLVAVGLIAVLVVVLRSGARVKMYSPSDALHEKVSSKDWKPPTRSSDELEAEAMVFAKDEITKHLKYPLDADFPWRPPAVSSSGDLTTFTVTGTVKAKNDYGGTHTYPWKVIARRVGNSFSPIYCEIEGKTVFVNDELLRVLTKPR